MKSTQKLAKRYMNKFIQDNSPVINPNREKILETIEHPDGSKTNVMNGEDLFGPVQMWPAQVDDFFNRVLLNYEGDIINYNNTINAMTENSPEINTRDYSSKEEYQQTLNIMLEATISAMSTGKKWQYIRDIGRKEKEGQGFLERKFREEKGLVKRLKRNEIVSKIIKKHNEQFQRNNFIRKIDIDADFKYIFA